MDNKEKNNKRSMTVQLDELDAFDWEDFLTVLEDFEAISDDEDALDALLQDATDLLPQVRERMALFRRDLERYPSLTLLAGVLATALATLEDQEDILQEVIDTIRRYRALHVVTR